LTWALTSIFLFSVFFVVVCLFVSACFLFLSRFSSQYEEKDPKTHEGLNLEKMTTKALFEYYKLEDSTQQFTGHAIALQPDEGYMNRPAKETLELIKLYAYSVSRYGNSPYIYPVYGLGGLPEGFSRLCAIHGGTYMLNKVGFERTHPITRTDAACG